MGTGCTAQSILSRKLIATNVRVDDLLGGAPAELNDPPRDMKM
jgi:hypothetical protein